MKRHFVRRLLALFLTLVMVFGVVPGREAKAEAISVWTPLADIDAAAASEKSVAVTMTTSAGATFVLPSANTSAAPAAKTGEISEGNLRAEGEESVYGWTVTALEGGGYTLQNAAGGYLYVTAANNGVRVGSLPTTGGEFSVTDGYLTASDSNGATRYIGVYNGQDFRCYTSNTGNIKDQTLQFWAYSETVEEDIPVVISTIAEALEGENGTKFTVKGVVTLVDGKNIYVQDATGGINLYFAAAPTDIALGDTLQAEGTRGAYSGVPQLAQAEAEKLTDPSELITLEAKEATLGGLSTDDLCTYVHIADLTVTAVSDTEINVKDADEATGLIYKPVLGDQTVKVGDGIDFTGAVGIYNSKFQLRNTEASEIKVTAGEDPIDPPVGDEIDKLTEPLTDGTFVVIYHPTSGMALTATASGSKLAGVTAAVADGKLTKTDDMAYMTVVESEGALAFELGGKYLTSGATGNSLTFADELTDLGRWTQEKQDDGTWYLMNVGANYNGNHNQALEYYNGFTTYGRKENNDAYKFEIYGVEAAPSYGLLDAVTNGAKVVIYHPTSSMTMTATASGAKLAGVASEMAAPNRLAKLDDMAYMTV
ncbi:MAG: hypothetical protein II930_07825, partial [Lachnospiraceae bacterium]|nr:hypothetical protein [Lachnospiraceae bacterium]